MALVEDVRYAWRIWRAYPVLTCAAVLSLALGMGANTAVFSVLNALLLKSAPVQDPRSLLAVYSTSATKPGLRGTSFKNYEDLRDTLPVGVAAFGAIPVGLSTQGSGQPEQVPAELVSGNYFDLLGVKAASGRTFTKAEDKAPNAHPIVVISDVLWKRRFGSRADVVDATVHLNARPFTVVGVMPAGFTGLDVMRPAEMWVPSSMGLSVLTGVHHYYFKTRASGMFDLVARTTPEAGPAQVLAMFQGAATSLEQTYPKDNKGLTFSVRPFQQARMNPVQRDKWVRAGGLLAVVVVLVLLIACANVANLLLARSASRRREVAVRLAVGASRRQLVRQLLAESITLSTAGALAGLVVAWGSLQVLSALRPAFVPPSFNAPLDWTVLAFTFTMAMVTGTLFGLIPALQSTRHDVVTGLKVGDLAPQRVSRTDFSLMLLVAQSALATVALILAGLFLRSVQRAQEINPGFDASNVAVVSFDLGMLRYDNTKGPEFIHRVVERVNAIPGVVSSAVSSHVLLDGPGLETKILTPGKEEAEALGISFDAIGLDYFKTMGIPMLDGRDFRWTDTGVSEFGWAVVNKTMAEQLWPGRTAVGQRFGVLGIKQLYEVLGVVADAQYETLAEEKRPYFYMFFDQVPGVKKLTLHVKTTADPHAMLGTLQREIQAVDPNLPLINVRTMSDVLAQAMWAPRTGAALLMLFGLMALLLAVVGVYGVTAFFVTRRRREIGIRAALGAPRSRILLPIASRALVPALVGLALGLAIALLGSQLVGSLLIGVEPTDALSFAGAVVVLAAAAAIASLAPAAAALRVDAAKVLRRE